MTHVINRNISYSLLCLCPSSLWKYSLGCVYHHIPWPHITLFLHFLLCGGNPLMLFIKDHLKQLTLLKQHICQMSTNESLYYKITNLNTFCFSEMLWF